MEAHQIDTIDMVVVNLYPFEETVKSQGCTLNDAIENIDIGGPTMVRAAAKNHAFVNIVVNSGDYKAIITEMTNNNGCTYYDTRFDLAVKAYEHTAAYDGMIANYLGKQLPKHDEQFPRTFNVQHQHKQTLRYGENPHQKKCFLRRG